MELLFFYLRYWEVWELFGSGVVGVVCGFVLLLGDVLELVVLILWCFFFRFVVWYVYFFDIGNYIGMWVKDFLEIN